MLLKIVMWFVVIYNIMAIDPSEYEHTIIVNSSYTYQTCMKKNEFFLCANLSQALLLPDLNNSCVILENNQTLNRKIELSNLIRFALIGKTMSLAITCNNSGNIVIERSTDITYYQLDIVSCGSFHSYISSAIRIQNSNEITFKNVVITKSLGYAVHLVNCTGTINFTGVNMSYNVPIAKRNISGYTSGGGLLMEYGGNTSNNKITLDNCNFLNNTGERNYTTDVSFFEAKVPFGRGAGLSVTFGGSSCYNVLTINQCQFTSNKGLWGGGLFVMFREHSSHNQVRVNGSTFYGNKAKIHGGGARIVSLRLAKLHSNKIWFKYSDFTKNAAGFGGGLSHYRQFFTDQEVMFSKNCLFVRNSGELGSAIYLARVTLVFTDGTNVSFNSLKWVPDLIVGLGAIYGYHSQLKFYGESFIQNNTHTAFVLDNSQVNILGNLNFMFNEGVKGGAMALYEGSSIVLNSSTSSSLSCQFNKATDSGGAIYMEISGPSGLPSQDIPLDSFPCFLIRNNNAKINFYNNIAFNNTFNDIFATTLRSCSHNLSYFGTRYVQTDPVKLDVFREDWMGRFPGELFSPRVELKDEFGNQVSRTIDVSSGKDLDSFFVHNNRISTLLIGDRYEIYDVTVSFGNIREKLKNLSLTYCPFGYTYFNGTCVCYNQKNNLRGLVCEEDGGISLFAGLYANASKTEIQHDNETTIMCPEGYCNLCPNLTCPYIKDKQCARGRTGYLCSQCVDNLTVDLGGETCVQKCGTYDYFWIILGIFCEFVIVCLVMVLFDVSLYHSSLNAFLYFYQVIEYHITASQQKEPIFVNDVIQNIVNLRGIHFGGNTIEICLFNEWNDLDKMMFNYLIPFVALLSVVLISNVKSLYDCLERARRKLQKCLVMVPDDNEQETSENFFNVYMLISTLAYADITRITFSLLRPTSYNGQRNLIYIYAAEKFFEGRHLYYFACAVFVAIFVVILWPVLLITFSVWTTWKGLQTAGGWYPIYRAFTGDFEDHCTWFASFYFIARGILIAVGVLLDSKIQQLTLVTLISIIFLVVFMVASPYKKVSSNIFDGFMLSLLVLIGIISVGKYGLILGYYNTVMFGITRILMHLPLLNALRWIYCFFTWMKLASWLQMKCDNNNGDTT